MDVSNIRSSSSQDVYQKRQNVSSSSSETWHPAIEQQTQVAGGSTQLNKEETEFFQQLFPSAADEIRSCQSYDKEGVKMAARLGAFVDKKG